MDYRSRVTPVERQALLEQYRKGSDPRVRLRAHILLLLAQGYSWAVIAGVLFCSTCTIAHWKTRVQDGGVTAVLGPQPTPQPRLGTWWSTVVTGWVTELTPRHFGFLRSRWYCEVIVLLLLEIHHLQVSPETVRRWLHREQLVWHRPRPVVGPTDPQCAAKLQALRQLLATLPANENAVFQDEVDIYINPKIGAMWMRCGQQAEILTPGTNEKRYLAGSLNWRTGALIVTEGFPKQGRNAALFVRHLDDLRCRLLCYRKIQVLVLPRGERATPPSPETHRVSRSRLVPYGPCRPGASGSGSALGCWLSVTLLVTLALRVSGQLLQQCLGLLQVFGIKSFGEPAGDLRQPPYCSEHRVEGNIRGGGVLSAPIRETSSHVLPYSPPSLSRSIGPAAASQYAT